jgi:hypothetical protein
VFGCKAIVQKPKAYRENKLSAQADECIYLGQARYHTGNIFMSLTTGKIFTSGVHATFIETEFPWKDTKGGCVGIDSSETDGVIHGNSYAFDPPDDGDDAGDKDYNPSESGSNEHDSNAADGAVTEIEEEASSSASPTPRPSQRRRVIESDSDDFTPSGEVLRGPRTPDSESANADTMPIRRSARVGGESLPYTVLNYSNLDEGDDSATEHSTSMCKRLLMSVESIDEHVHIGHPKPFKPHQIKDLPQDEQQLWEDARIKEYNTLVENGTFIDEKPIDELDRVIPLGETLRYKRDGTRKSRMYVQGFKQIPGVDFDLSYSPTISHGGFRLFIVLSVLTSPYNGAADAIAAYTQSDLPLDEQVWVRKPKKFRKYINGREMASLLGKSLYGLVQSGRNWWLKLSEWLMAFGFEVAFSEPCLYVLRRGHAFMILATYVDDMPWGSNDMTLVHDVFDAMRKDDFKLTWYTNLTEVLGAQVQDVGDGVVLHQADYINKIISVYASDIEQHEALLRGQVQTPCTTYLAKDVIDAQESKVQIIDDLDPKFATRYRSLVGGLLYASVVSNPDISYTVGQLCRAMSFPNINLWNAALHCLTYLKHRGTMGLKYYKNPSDSPILGVFRDGTGMVRGMVDASWDIVRSTSGWLIFVNGSLVDWGSKRQNSISLSANEAETMAASLASQRIQNFRNTLADLGWKQTEPSPLLSDSKGAKALADNPIMKGMARHITRRELYVRELTKKNVLRVYHVQTELNVSDMLTKALAANKFAKFRGLIMVHI